MLGQKILKQGGGGFWQEAMVLCSRLQLAAPTGGGGGAW